MSVKIMGLVWDADLPREEKYILLAYADHADHDGRSIYPSVDLVAWKTGYSRRAIQLITARLVNLKILVPEKKSYLNTNQYRIDISQLPNRPSFSPRGGANFAPPEPLGGAKNDIGGAESAQGGAKTAWGGAIASAPDPSFKPSVKPSTEPEESVPEIWLKFLAHLQYDLESESQHSKNVFHERIAPVSWGGLADGTVILCAPDAESAAWLQERFGKRFEREFSGYPELAGKEVIFVAEPIAAT